VTERDAKEYDDEQVWRILRAYVEEWLAGRSIDQVKDPEQQVAEMKERIRSSDPARYPAIELSDLGENPRTGEPTRRGYSGIPNFAASPASWDGGGN
jgi:hypothetical protein